MYKLFLYIISLKTITINIWVTKIGTYINLLLQLNKLKINILILLLIFYCTFTFLNRILLNIAVIYSFFFKLVFINFIQLFTYGFFKIHILFFYFFTILSFVLNFKNYYISLKCRMNFILLYTILSFILGSWWSLYLFNWGYYWTNDSIEYILLFFIVWQVIKLHSWNSNYTVYFIFSSIILYVLIAIRLNIIYTRHNFFKLDSLIYFNIKYIWLMILQYCIIKNKFIINLISCYRISLVQIMFVIVLILSNSINFFILKLISYNLYFILLIYWVLINDWYKTQFVYTHIFVVIIYICFILITICYMFFSNLKQSINMVDFYNIYFQKYLVYYHNLNNNNRLKVIDSMSILFNKGGNEIKVSTDYLISKKLINFIN